MRDSDPADAPRRYSRWLDELRQEQTLRDYASYDELAQRLMRDNPRLRPDRANFLARHWGGEVESGRIVLKSDPAHKRINPILYRSAEVLACLRSISAPVLWVEGEHTDMFDKFRIPLQEVEDRKRHIQDCKTCVVPNAGHMLHHDEPELVARLIEQFLQE